MIELTCQCCGHTESFASDDAAFDEGWDDPTHFPGMPTACKLCPGVAAMGLVDHSEAHKIWAEKGRPAEFSWEGMPPL